MDSMETILFKLTIPTCDINTELLQEILSSSRKIFKSHEIIDDIIHKLWEHMSAKLSEFDDQLLCCTCFYTLLTFSEKQDEYLMEIFNILNDTLLLEQREEVEHKNVEVYFQHWYDQLVYEHNLERNIVDSIHEGKQMHSILGLLLVIFESCLEYGYRLDIPRETIWNICSVLEDISKQFISDENSTVSYDFSKMSELVESLIRKSNTTLKDQYDETNISGLHQNVLSCLWLNVKMSCDLSAILIEYNAADETICSKCLNTITHVLETCRHKGAIEAAGTALGKSIQYLTSLTGSDVSNLPFNLLERKLEELIGEANKMASVTRRGAGLSIMVHRIVSSDMKKGKPLFHYFINIMLKTCTSFNGTANEDSCSSENDLPKAIYIHFLTKIVTDSCLASEMMYYSASLAELAFGNLTSPHWQIRNASLQLYGALIPKLIGQKKASGQDEETVATVACDEFKTHSPKLWKYILDQIENIDNADIIQSHSDLIATWVELAENLQTILCFDDFEIHSEIICNKIDNSLEVSEELLYDIAKGLLSAHLSIRCQGLWKVLYRISLKAELKSLVDNESFKQQISNLEYRNRYFIPFASRILDDEEGLLKISNVIYWLCHPNTTDTDMRFIASLANNELATKFFNLPETVKIICIKSAVILLQDEDEDIRNLSTNFYFNIKKGIL
ncbi:unnamed protein product [Leptosia nina]|uniref:DUF2428 domain-containing protein n=1 Tax=Leptosia nina TaxID=320188 RepID=A0AAV1J3X2_9NEOP